MALYDFLRSFIVPLKKIDDLLPVKGKIIDLGCGQGLIAKKLSQKKTRMIIGIDQDNSRLPKSDKKNLQFISHDIRTYPINNANGIILSDVLHHMNFIDQKKLLSSFRASLGKNGVLLIKEIDTEEFIRSKLSRFWDFIFYPSDKIYYWSSKKLQSFLKESGFSVQIERASRLFPGSTTLFICKKSG